MIARNYSLSRSFHFSSLGPACIVSKGILLAASSMELIIVDYYINKTTYRDVASDLNLIRYDIFKK